MGTLEDCKAQVDEHRFLFLLHCYLTSLSVEIKQLEGNVLRNLRPAMFQMVMGKIFTFETMSSSHVHYVQMSMMSEYP